MNIISIINNSITRLAFRKKGVIIAHSSVVSKESILESGSKICKHVIFSGSLGYGSYISNNCNIWAKVGRFCSIGSNVNTLYCTHPFKPPYVSTSPMFFSTLKQTGETFATEQFFTEFTNHPIIENDVWIGSNVLIIGEVHIQDGAVISAGSVVTKDVPAYSIVAGVPAKIIGYRYSEDTILKLLKIKWWNKDKDWLKSNWKLFANINKFMEEYGQ